MIPLHSIHLFHTTGSSWLDLPITSSPHTTLSKSEVDPLVWEASTWLCLGLYLVHCFLDLSQHERGHSQFPICIGQSMMHGFVHDWTDYSQYTSICERKGWTNTFLVSFNHKKYGSSANDAWIAVTDEGISASVRGVIVTTIVGMFISVSNCTGKLSSYTEQVCLRRRGNTSKVETIQHNYYRKATKQPRSAYPHERPTACDICVCLSVSNPISSIILNWQIYPARTCNLFLAFEAITNSMLDVWTSPFIYLRAPSTFQRHQTQHYTFDTESTLEKKSLVH